MPPIQTTDRVNFGTGRLFETSGGVVSPIANLTDVTVDFKVDLKEAFGEGAYPIFVADSHRSIDITAKHYTMNPEILQSALGGTLAAGGVGQVLDEAATVPALTPFTHQVAGHATFVPGSLYLVAFPLTGGVAVPTVYALVTAGTETAGASASIDTATGTLTFAAGDAGIAFQTSYQTTESTGTQLSVVNTFQNSGKVYQLACVKRDISPIDNSTADLVYHFWAARTAGVKAAYTEGAFTVYERMYKAFADSAGRVVDVSFANL